jgi:AcrR family transcriptional regulator
VSRPRSAESHAAILQAAIELVVEGGLQGTSIEAIAARAGVGKATIYRRWKTKEDLFAEALRTVVLPLPDPDTGSLRGDVVAVAAFNLGNLPRKAALLMPRLMVEGADDPELFTVMREVLVDPRRRVFKDILRRAIGRGELREDLDLEDATDMLIGPLIYEILITGADLTKIVPLSERILDMALAGMAPTPASRGRARRRPAA